MSNKVYLRIQNMRFSKKSDKTKARYKTSNNLKEAPESIRKNQKVRARVEAEPKAIQKQGHFHHS